jgi:hypothetical protein
VESKEPRAKIKSAPYPIWEAWVEHVVQDIEVASRKGIPRGEQLPFPYKKLLAAILMTIYPRGLRTTDKVGSYVKASSALIRKWRREPRFQAQVQEFEVQFARYVLGNLNNDDFLLSLYKSDHEPAAWSDSVLLIFFAEIGNALGALEGKESAEKERIIADYRAAISHVEGFVPFEVTATLPEDPEDLGLYESMLYDLAGSAILARGTSRPGKRGRKPYSAVRYRTAEIAREVFYERPVATLASVLELIEHNVINNVGKDEVLRCVKIARDLADKELSGERGEERISSTETGDRSGSN